MDVLAVIRRNFPRNANIWIATTALLLVVGLSRPARAGLVVERRSNPASKAEGFCLLPAYSHIPGLGSSYGAAGAYNNLLGTQVDLIGVGLFGDLSGAVLAANDVHLIKDNLIMNFAGFTTKIPHSVYERGPDSPDKFLSTITKEYGLAVGLDLHYWERRLQFNARIGTSRYQTASAASSDGALYDNQDANEVDSIASTMHAQLDLTDDTNDPRKGIRLQVIRRRSEVFDGLHSSYYTIDGIATAYVPVLRASTWAFNVFRSSAIMMNRNTDGEAQLRDRMSLNCGRITDAAGRANCQALEDLRVEERLAENNYGTANTLGGAQRLRGYPSGRFHGSQSLFFATEFRWNITSENTPFNLGFIKGSRSLIQVAPYYEIGAAVDPPHTVEQAPYDSSYGVGLRFGFSGMIMRADAGFSREGAQFTFFAGYPWNYSAF